MNPPLRTLLVDDERLARKALRSLLTAHPEVIIVAEAATIAEAAAHAARQSIDLIFLDVQMPPANGFDLIPLLPGVPEDVPAIIFMTAHEQYAVRAFEVSAIDYLLKPTTPERLATAIQRVLGRAPAKTTPVPLRADDTLILRDGRSVRRVALADIAAVEADGHYSRVYLANEPPMHVQRGITVWTAQLPAPDFLQLDRSLIVNLTRVHLFDMKSRDLGELTLRAEGNPLRLGRAASARLRAALSN